MHIDLCAYPALWVVCAVRRQQCGGCWSFAATGAIEGAFAIGGGSLTSLSEQQIISCDYASEGCKGGSPGQAFSWVATGNPLCAEEDWPYTSTSGASRGRCSSTCKPVVSVADFHEIVHDEDGMVTATSKQPIAASVVASSSLFQLYHSGIFDDASCGSHTQVDHAVRLMACCVPATLAPL